MRKRIIIIFTTICVLFSALTFTASAEEVDTLAIQKENAFPLSHFASDVQMFYPASGSPYILRNIYFPGSFCVVRANEEDDGEFIYPGYEGRFDADYTGGGLERGSVTCLAPGEKYTLQYVELDSLPENHRFFLSGSINVSLGADPGSFNANGSYSVHMLYFDSDFKQIGTQIVAADTQVYFGAEKYYTFNYQNNGVYNSVLGRYEGFQLSYPQAAKYFVFAISVQLDFIQGGDDYLLLEFDFSDYDFSFREDYYPGWLGPDIEIEGELDDATTPGFEDISNWINELETFFGVFGNGFKVYANLLGYLFNRPQFQPVLLIMKFCFYMGLFGVLLNLAGSAFKAIFSKRGNSNG